GKTLASECPRPDWRLCALRDELPSGADDVLWGPNRPLERIGGPDDPPTRPGNASITLRSIRPFPLQHLPSSLALAAEQMVTVGATESMNAVESWYTKWTLETYAPWLVAPYEASRQQRGADLSVWSAWVVSPAAIAGTGALPIAAVLAWRRRRRRGAMLPAPGLLALLGHAALCGPVSGPHGRYQARLALPAPVCVAGGAAGMACAVLRCGGRCRIASPRPGTIGQRDRLTSRPLARPRMKSMQDAVLKQPPTETDRSGSDLELTILMPCLNEAETIEACIAK